MSTETTCPNPECRRTYTLDDRLAGRTARCRHCQTCFEVRLGEGELMQLEIASNAR